MVNGKRKIQTFIIRTTTMLFTVYCLMFTVQAQVDEPPSDAAPPPVYVIPKDEKKTLNDTKDLKKHTQLSLEYLNVHLTNAEKSVEENSFQNALSELGNYQAILENSLRFLNSQNNGGGKVKDNYKRLEIGLRPAISRLEIVRRGMPYSYGYYVRELQKVVRDARAKALEPLFDNSIVKPEQK